MQKGLATRKAPSRRTASASSSAKRRVMAVASLALVGVLAVGGTLAWLTDETERVVNAFEPAEVTCAVDETFDGATKSNVAIKNTGDVDAFIRAAIVVNWVDAGGNVHGTKVPTSADYSLVLSEGAGWTEGADGFYYFGDSVTPGEPTDVLISSCALAKGAAAPAGYYLAVDILAEAIQAEGDDGSATPADSWDNALVDVTAADGKLTIAAKTA